ncbi:MAG TPA: mechanosensitive ion channel domain-containing protein [Longimicrobiaceae bacterium]|nr:mechanosensitive ion channel domain-containing protein [Longimicrobiaceae bacterium]
MQTVFAAMIQTDSLVEELTERVRTEWSDIFNWPELTATGLRVLAAFVVGWLAFWALKLLLRRIERSIEPSESGLLTVQEQRSKTLLSLVRSIGIVVIIVLMIFMVLGALGVNVGPLLAGAGVIGLAVSFGAQSLVKDIISGLFILFENQYAVGDVIRLDTGISGAVERMTLRVVVLRDVFGVVHIVPNGEIKRVSNLTRTWSRVVLDVGVAYKEDVDRVMEVMRDVGREMYEDPEWKHFLVEEIVVPGVEAFAESSVNIRIMAKTVPLKQWDVGRELRRRLKRRFDAEGIEIPFPQRTVHYAAESVASGLAGSGAGDGGRKNVE